MTPFTFTPVPPVHSHEPEKEYVSGIVENESGDLYVYLEKPDDYYAKYPEKKDTSFNMWELKYFIDVSVDGILKKGIEVYIDPGSKRIQYIARDVGELCHAIKKGSRVKINKEAWDKVIPGKNYILPEDLIVLP
jgi:hypothetical protein